MKTQLLKQFTLLVICGLFNNYIFAQATNPCQLSANAGDDATYCNGIPVQLNATGGTMYAWSPADGLNFTNVANPIATPTVTTVYTVTVSGVSAINLLTNGDFESGNTGFSTDYAYVASDANPAVKNELQPPAVYSVGNDAYSYHESPVWGGFAHLGNNFMIINGTTDPNEVVWQESIAVVAGTNYSFSGWISTLYPDALTTLRLIINGSVVATGITPSNPVGTWTSFGGTWTAPVTGMVDIQFVDDNLAYTGNDYGLDDLSFNAICSATDVVTVTNCQNPPPPFSCQPVTVLDYNPGLRKNGTAVLGARQMIANALTIQDSDAPGPINFLSLGFGGTGAGGSVVLDFGGFIANPGPGADINVYETTWGYSCATYPEKVLAFGSVGSSPYSWVPLSPPGGICMNGSFEFPGTQVFRYIMLVDNSSAAAFSDPLTDGYDLDGVECVNGLCENCDPPPNEGPCAANYFVPGSYMPGKTNQTPPQNIQANRNQPTRALGVAQGNDTYNFATLGFGGEITLGFNTLVINRVGLPDLKITETSFGSPKCVNYPETVHIWGSYDGGAHWTDLGTTCLDGLVELGSMPFANLFRLKDESNPTKFSKSATTDGYDVDALECYFGNGRLEDEVSFTNENSILAYPNPVSDVLNVNLPVADFTTVKVVNLLGQVIYSDSFYGNEDAVTAKIDFTNYASGIYVIAIENELGIQATKVIKK